MYDHESAYSYLKGRSDKLRSQIAEKQQVAANLQQSMTNDAREILRIEAKLEQLSEMFPELEDPTRKAEDVDVQDRPRSPLVDRAD